MNVVLLAEDEPVSRRFLCDALQSIGHRCDAVEDGARALERASATRYDLLLFDRELPGLGGDEVLRRLRATPAAASHRTPAVALTADPDPAAQRELLGRGFAAVGSKPLSLAALDALLAPWLAAPAGWNDAQGLAACGGDAAALRTLRGLMLDELPSQLRELADALREPDPAGARATLHRLRAACGFCGADELAQRVDALHAAPGDPGARLAFERAAAALLSDAAQARGSR